MEILFPILTAFFVTCLAVLPTIKLAQKYNLVDNPKLRPHPAHTQNRIIPRAGGLAIFTGIVTAIFLFIPLDKHIYGIIISLVILLIVGLLDDFWTNFNPYLRLLFQFLVAAVVVASGVGITFVNNPFGGILRLDSFVYTINLFGKHNIILIADIFAFLWIVWVMNMTNWSKGVDGQMPGTIAVAAIIIGAFSYKLFIGGDQNQLGISLLAFITAGSALGFLVFNWHPAKIIPGFSGSTILGFMIATLSILSGAKLAIALLVLLVPAVDFLYTFFRRVLEKKSPLVGDRKHLHHLLLDKGWSHRRISLFYITSCAILGLLAINLSSKGKLFTLLGLAVIILGGIIWLNFFSGYSKQADRDNG